MVASNPAMILLIDNYDSFVHNLARYLRRLGASMQVVRNDVMAPDEIVARKPQAIVFSPGPCTPSQAGCSLDLVRAAAGRIPMLGVCLGHQTIGEAFGGRVVRAPEPMHGRASRVVHDGRGLFAGLPSPLTVGRYHSLVVEDQSLPDALQVTARSEDGVVMALAHEQWPIFGVQFHPESVLTEGGYTLLANFLRLAGIDRATLPPSIDQERPPALLPAPLPAGPVTF
jgi:anthranilate synthase/aminodeoxychorismate synthase-like glutamine amidotransferase